MSTQRCSGGECRETEELEPTGGLSSAASCITLHLRGHSFRPVYSHQCFEAERIRGYEPSVEACEEAYRLAEVLRKQRSKSFSTSTTSLDDEKKTSDSVDASLPHPSHKHDSTSSHRLSISVTLAPSCTKCAIFVLTERTKKRSARLMSSVRESLTVSTFSNNHNGKSAEVEVGRLENFSTERLRKRDHSTNYAESSNSSLLCDSDDSRAVDTISNVDDRSNEQSDNGSSFCPSSCDSIDDEVITPQGKTRRRRMEMDEIIERISRALPEVVRCDVRDGRTRELIAPVGNDATNVEMDYLKKPLGIKLREYSCPIRGTQPNNGSREEGNFELYLADGKDRAVAQYHNQVQKLALWFIETADCVNLTSNEGGGFWKVLYLFRTHDTFCLSASESKEGDGKIFEKIDFENTRHDTEDCDSTSDASIQQHARSSCVAGLKGSKRKAASIKLSAAPSRCIGVRRSSRAVVHKTYARLDKDIDNDEPRIRYAGSDMTETETISNCADKHLDDTRRLKLPNPTNKHVCNAQHMSRVTRASEQWNEETSYLGESKTPSSRRKKQCCCYSLAGYMTLFYFCAPFKKPKPGMIMRICQALILPPYQRAGHGNKMLHAVHDIANGIYDSVLYNKTKKRSAEAMMLELQEVVEINVEDPASAFVALRNRFDYELLRNCSTTPKGGTTDQTQPTLRLPVSFYDESSFEPLSEGDAKSIGSLLRITPRQVQVAYEIFKLDMVEKQIDDSKKFGAHGKSRSKDDPQQKVEELEKGYRLMVKKRLNQVHREDIGACSTRVDKQELLAKIYAETLHYYRLVLRRR